MLKPNTTGVFNDDVEGDKHRVARKLLAQGHAPEQVAKACGLTVSEVRKLLPGRRST